MNALLWLLAGAAAGFMACSVLDLGAARSALISATIGIVGVFFGGEALAPAIGDDRYFGGPSPFALLVTSAVAMGCVKIAGLVRPYFQRTAIEQAKTQELPVE